MVTQLNLFESHLIGYNKAVRALLSLDHKKARGLLKAWEKKFPGKRDLVLEYKLLGFLENDEIKRCLEKDPVSAFHIWNSCWEKEYEARQNSCELLGLFRRGYFKHVGACMLKWMDKGGDIDLDTLLACLQRAQAYENLVGIGKRWAAEGQASARALGYLADGLWETGQQKEALSVYLTAMLEGPEKIDRKHVSNQVVKRLLARPMEVLEDFLGETVDLEIDKPEYWAATVGLMAKIFEAPGLEDGSKISSLYRKVKIHEPGDHEGDGIVFARCIILSEQGIDALSLVNIDIAAVRGMMKSISERLFYLYMKSKGLHQK